MRKNRLAKSLLWLLFPAAAQSEDPLDSAKRAFDAGRYAEAARLFEESLAASPACRTRLFLGMARYRLRQTDRALIDFRSAVACDAALVEARIALAEAYIARGADGRAIEELERVLGAEPRHAAALSLAAALYLKNQMNPKAVEALEKLSALDSANPSVLANLGAAYAATSRFDKAEPAFEAALRTAPGHTSALTGLANLYLKTERAKDAALLLERAVRGSPTAYEAHYLLGLAYLRLGRNAEAVRELEAAARAGAGDPEIYYGLSRALRAAGRDADSKQALARFADLKAKAEKHNTAEREVAGLLREAKSMVDKGDVSGAIAAMEKARELQPAGALLLFRLAGLYFDARRYPEARQAARQAIGLAPDEWTFHYLLGSIERASGTLAAARASLETAVLLNPASPDAHNLLGDVALRQNDPARAVKEFREALRLDPTQEAYRLNLEAAERTAR